MLLQLLSRASRSDSSRATGSANKTAGSNTSAGGWTESTSSGPTWCPPGSTQHAPALAGLPEVRRLVVTQALDHLFTASYFSICHLDPVMDILNAPRHSEAYKLLRALHCVDYAAMRPELRERIPQLVNECLAPPAVVDCLATNVALNGVAV